MAVTSATSGAALDAALAAAERGWHTFPLAGKVPFAGSHGHLDATADPTAVRAAMTNRRAIAYGIATGAVSGVVVIDVDGDAGRDSLAALEAELGPLPDAPTVITASGGEHRYFRHPGGHVPTTAGKLADGVDTRADGGFVVGAGSVLPDGRTYCWEVAGHPDDVPLPPLPPAWLAAIRAAASPRPVATMDDATPIAEGGRNHALASIAGHLRRAGLSEAAMRAALLEVNAERCRPPLPDGAVARVAASVARYPAGQLPPMPAMAATADPCADARDALAAARAELAAVAAERAALADQVRTLQERARAQDLTIGILMNPDLGPAAVTAVALVDRLRARQPDRPDHDASHRVPHAALAARTGRSVDATSDHVRRLATLTDPDGAPLFHREVVTVPERVDMETGEILPLHREQFVGTGPVTAEHIATALATYATPTKRTHGGARVANPPCPVCGSRHRRTVCGDCGATVQPTANTTHSPNRQDAGLAPDGPDGPEAGPGPAPGAAPITLFRQDAGLADVAETTPGEAAPLEAAVQRRGPLPAQRARVAPAEPARVAPAQRAWAAPAEPPPPTDEDAAAAAADTWSPLSDVPGLRQRPRFGFHPPAPYDRWTDLAPGSP